MIFNVPKTLTTIGINEPITINNDCFEKKMYLYDFDEKCMLKKEK